MFEKKHKIAAVKPIQALVDKSLKDLEDNSKAIEEALEKFAQEEGVEISQKEYNELKSLSDTLGELDYALLKLSEPPKKQPVKKKKKRKSTKKKTSKKTTKKVK